MPVTFTDLREQHGSVFITETPDGLVVPWMPLSIGDFLEYDVQFRAGAIAPSVLENEIFTKCVTDKVLVKNFHLQKAGTVTTVVKSIMQASGPNSIDEMNETLDYFRGIAAQPMHQLVSVICRAFPGYTPDDVYQMDYQKMTLRLALAESKLMALGLMSEPIVVYPPGVDPDEKPKRPEIKVDPKKLKEAFDLQKTQPMKERVKKAREQGAKKVELSSERETDEIDLGSTKQGETFIVTSNLMMMGMEIGDEDLGRQMKKDAKSIYSDYLKMGNKVKIKSVEERLKEFEVRQEANKKKYIASLPKRKK